MTSDSSGGRLELGDLKETVGRKVFPLHASFFLGELALFAFIGLVTTGIYLGFFYEASTRIIEFQGENVPAAYASVVEINGLTMGLIARRVHHWSAHIMIAAIVVHMARVYFHGAYKKPRDINWVIGCMLLLLTVMAAFVGYLLPFDEFALTATGIGYNIVSSIPWIGPAIAKLGFAGPFPNLYTVPRFYSWHIMLIPLTLSALIGVHLLVLFKLKHTQHATVTQRLREQAGDLRQEGIVGMPFWPEQALTMLVIFFTYAAGVSLLAAFVPVHPVETYGPPEVGTPVMKPDWYLLWVFGILRLIPSIDATVLGGGITAEFIGGILVPGTIVVLLFAVPFVDERVTSDTPETPAYVETEQPVDHPGRTAIGIGAIVFFIASSAAGYVNELGLTVATMTGIVLVVPVIVGVAVYLLLSYRLRLVDRSLEEPNSPDIDDT